MNEIKPTYDTGNNKVGLAEFVENGIGNVFRNILLEADRELSQEELAALARLETELLAFWRKMIIIEAAQRVQSDGAICPYCEKPILDKRDHVVCGAVA